MSGPTPAQPDPATPTSVSPTPTPAPPKPADRRGRWVAILTGALSILIGLVYLVLITVLDARGPMQPPPPEALGLTAVPAAPAKAQPPAPGETQPPGETLAPGEN